MPNERCVHACTPQDGLRNKTMRVRVKVIRASCISSRGVRGGLTSKISIASRNLSNYFLLLLDLGNIFRFSLTFATVETNTKPPTYPSANYNSQDTVLLFHPII